MFSSQAQHQVFGAAILMVLLLGYKEKKKKNEKNFLLVGWNTSGLPVDMWEVFLEYVQILQVLDIWPSFGQDWVNFLQ